MSKDYFSYNSGTGIIPKDDFRISPSQLSKFFDSTSQWYREHLLGEEGFTGNTATYLGTCVHAAAEMYTDSGKVDHSAILSYIDSIKDPEVDKQEIRSQYPVMVNTLIAKYLSLYNHPVETEIFVHEELLPKVHAAGSIDRYDETRRRIIDYKSIGSLDKARVPTKFPRNYWFQQMTYAWILKKQGKPVDFVDLVYISRSNTGRISEKTGKPMKDYPSEVNILTHQITQDDMDAIEGILQLVSESVDTWNSHPELRHILAQDQRLKAKKPPRLFKN
jgi:hypothetical protein